MVKGAYECSGIPEMTVEPSALDCASASPPAEPVMPPAAASAADIGESVMVSSALRDTAASAPLTTDRGMGLEIEAGAGGRASLLLLLRFGLRSSAEESKARSSGVGLRVSREARMALLRAPVVRSEERGDDKVETEGSDPMERVSLS